MKVLFATKNPAKIKRYLNKLEEKGIQVLTLKDIDIKLEVEETGKNALENAYLKAKAYYDATGIISIGIDDTLFIEGLSDEKQPGANVRRVNGKELSDDEMIEHYTNLVKEHGEKLIARWVYGMAIYNGSETKQFTWSKGNFYFVDKPCKKRNLGYPLDSISIMPEYNKYFVDLTPEEKNSNKSNDEGAINFILESLIGKTMQIPEFFKEKLIEQYGEQLTQQIMEGYSKHRAVTLRVKSIKS